MEVKEMIGKTGFPSRAHFIGKKCLKFLESNFQANKTVSIVPIIGGHGNLLEPGESEFNIYKEETKPELF